MPYDVAIEKLKVVLKDHQIGVVSENAMHETINSKVPGAQMDPYIVLGVCNAGYAYKVIQAEENVGLLLPCKAIVKYIDDNRSEVAILDPAAAGSVVGNETVTKVFEEVSIQLKKVLKEL